MPRRGENIYKRKDGRYEGRYIKGYDSAGKAIYGYVYSPNYADLKNKLLECKANVKNNKCPNSTNTTVSQWFEFWLLAQKQIKESTRAVYRGYIDNHVVPSLGKYALHKLNEDLLQNFIGEKSEILSVKTVHSVFTMMKTAFKAAKDKGLMNDVYTKIKLPKLEKKEQAVLSKKEQKALEKSIEESKDENDIGVLICLYTGIRIGELCALTWQNIDFDTATLHVEKGVQRVAVENADTKTSLLFSTPKSIASKRKIPLPKFLLDKLKSLKKESGFIINNSGNVVEPRTYRRYFKRLLTKAGIAEIPFHATRHTFSTRALEIGMDIKTLSEILGHSSATITLKQYAHSLQEHKRKEIERLGQLYSQSD